MALNEVHLVVTEDFLLGLTGFGINVVLVQKTLEVGSLRVLVDIFDCSGAFILGDITEASCTWLETRGLIVCDLFVLVENLLEVRKSFEELGVLFELSGEELF